MKAAVEPFEAHTRSGAEYVSAVELGVRLRRMTILEFHCDTSQLGSRGSSEI